MAQQSDPKPTEADETSAGEPTATPSSVEPMDKDAGLDASAAPYGTRSRNRAGNPRPNYAEDKDFDTEMYDYVQGDQQKKSSRQSAGAGQEPARGASSRKSLGDEVKVASQANGTKEQGVNGSAAANSSSQSASNAAQTSSAASSSRKRKAATQQNGSSGTGSTSNSSNNNGSSGIITLSTRRAGAGGSQNAATTPAAPAIRQTNMMTFSDSNARPQNGRLVADDGTVLEANDHVYLVCEPPGEPYYLARIMEFLHQKNDASKPVDSVRVNWFYRPRDIGRKSHDTRVVYATMHSDINPLTALRGKCQVRHRSEIDNMEQFRRTPDSFWFEKLYDRYIQKNYDLIPTSTIVNVPEKVKKVLDERWKFVLVEQGRGKELTSASKSCKRCSGYCASNESVDCAVCQNTYHMHCVKPPLLKKPSRGFAWSCAACSRAQERKLEARHTPNIFGTDGDAEDDEVLDEDEEDPQIPDTGRNSPTGEEGHHQGTAEQIYHASLWPWRYLGMHCKPEDALDYDDRIYPRASTRIGPRHQATVLPWPGQPVQYVKPPETKKGSKSQKNKEASEAEQYPRGQRPKWVQDMPPGYVARGEDTIDLDDPNSTAAVLWQPPTSDERGQETDEFMKEVRGMGKELGLPERSTNLQDVALQTLVRRDYDKDKAIEALPKIDKREFDEPSLTSAEQKKFEEGVGKYGSELYLVKKHVKTMTPGHIVRHYYTWKKTDKGKQIWGNYTGRKSKKEAKRAEAAVTKLADDVADADDDSAFDSIKAVEKKRNFMCQFCSAKSSRRWRRPPNPSPTLVLENGAKPSTKDKASPQYVIALCARCAELWRRYAIRWEDIEEMSKKVAAAGGRAWKRRQDEELLKELQIAREVGIVDVAAPPPPPPPSVPADPAPASSGPEPPRKKLKSAPDKEPEKSHSDIAAPAPVVTKKKEVEAVVVPEMPKPRTLPCAVCAQMEPLGDQHFCCRECRLTVHRSCYGIPDGRSALKWTCDMCLNDKNPQVSIHYKCVLCPVDYTEQELVEQRQLTHHKKKMTEKDREREKLEVQQARKAVEEYKKKQQELNRPLNPREPLKRTADNNWVHVTCAIWTPEVKFGNAKALEPSEGIPSIPRSKYEEVCQVCTQQGGACVSCLQCKASYHVECARQHGHVLGFDLTPIKGSRRDQFNIVTVNGDSGVLVASMWCKDHAPTKTIVHKMHDIVDESGLNALQLYVQNFKQADLGLTGTVRKATLMTTSAKISAAPTQASHRRPSTTTVPNGHGHGHADEDTPMQYLGDKVCISCGIDVSPSWWPISLDTQRDVMNDYASSFLGEEARKFVEQRKVQCHKCHKSNRTPRPPAARLGASSTGPDSQATRVMSAEPTPPAQAPVSLQSPPTMMGDYREARHPPPAWPTAHGQPPQQTPPPAAHLIPSVAHQGHPSLTGARLPPVPPSYPHPPLPVSTAPPVQPPHRPQYGEWGAARPASGHGSPHPHMNGGQSNLYNGPPQPPPEASVSVLRPPMAGAPPGHAPYMNGMPQSPQRVSGHPPPTSPYLATFATSQGHVPGHGPSHNPHQQAPPPPPPPHAGHQHHLSNGVAPPRAEYPAPPVSNMHRSPFAAPASGPHGSPSARYERYAAPEPPSAALHQPRYGTEPPRPATGASASPSLRNLLS